MELDQLKKILSGGLKAKIRLAKANINLNLEETKKAGVFFPKLEGLVEKIGLSCVCREHVLSMFGISTEMPFFGWKYAGNWKIGVCKFKEVVRGAGAGHGAFFFLFALRLHWG